MPHAVDAALLTWCALQVRARHDGVNSVSAGCFTGGVLARQGAAGSRVVHLPLAHSCSAGWQGMLGGCVTFGAFSLLMDTLMDH
jgi:Tim17/Tim22/Tim23/Pmp24 family